MNSKVDNLGDFIGWLCSIDEVYGYTFEGEWFDVGSPDTYIDALKAFMDNYIASNAKIDKHARIIEPVVIEEGVRIVGRSIIGPYAYIGRGCTVENSDVCESILFGYVLLREARLWRSIVDHKCEIRNIDLCRSVIGAHTKIQRGYEMI